MFKYTSNDYRFSVWISFLVVIGYLFNLPEINVAQQMVPITVLVYLVFIVAGSAGFHYLFTHRAYQTNRFWQHVLLYLGTISMYGSSIQWATVHSIHHKYSDTDEDPHNYKTWKDLFLSKPREAKIGDLKDVAHLINDPLHRWYHNNYWLIIYVTLLALLVISPTFALYGYFIPVSFVIVASAIFNFTIHKPSGPQNKRWWIYTGTSEWKHYDHHKDPSKWDFRDQWHKYDLVATFISAIRTKK